MTTGFEEGLDFEIDLKKLGWIPKKIDEILALINRAFEKKLSLNEVQLFGTDHVEKTRLKEDKDIKVFLRKKSMTNEQTVKLRLPDRLIPRDWKPKKVKILVKGHILAKYYGDEYVPLDGKDEDTKGETSTREVEISLKIYSCGHFYMKQTLSSSGASPYWVIFEGTYRRTDRGLHLTYLFRYAWQTSRKTGIPGKPELDFNLEAVPNNHESSLAWYSEQEKQLNGMVPAIVGTEPFCWVEICQEGKVTETRTCFNEEPERETWQQKLRREGEEEESLQEQKEKKDQTKIDEEDEFLKEQLAQSPQLRGQLEQRMKGLERTYPEDSEPMWPILLGVAFFLFVFFVFAYLWWEENAARSVPSAVSIEDDEL